MTLLMGLVIVQWEGTVTFARCIVRAFSGAKTVKTPVVVLSQQLVTPSTGAAIARRDITDRAVRSHVRMASMELTV